VAGGGLVGGKGVPVGGGIGVAVTTITTTVCTPVPPSAGCGTKIGCPEPGTKTCAVGGGTVGKVMPGKRVTSKVAVATNGLL
jgi:hypothetical protein